MNFDALHPRDATPEQLQRMRELAELTVAAAASWLGVTPTNLILIEAGAKTLRTSTADRMAELYGCGEMTEEE